MACITNPLLHSSTCDSPQCLPCTLLSREVEAHPLVFHGRLCKINLVKLTVDFTVMAVHKLEALQPRACSGIFQSGEGFTDPKDILVALYFLPCVPNGVVVSSIILGAELHTHLLSLAVQGVCACWLQSQLGDEYTACPSLLSRR
jgi:hypothetical protein